MTSLFAQPHRRRNALTGDWILVSPHRNERPWQGAVDHPVVPVLPPHDPACYLCPGNERAGGVRNPAYSSTFVFTNDFSALLPGTPDGESNRDGLLQARAERGICRVVCFSPRHDLTLADMTPEVIRGVVDVWADEYTALGARPEIHHVQIFENRGALMGASNPHPHGQIWAQDSIPVEPAKEGVQQSAYFQEHGRTLLGDYVALEEREGERIVAANASFVALVPYWAVWPFETMIVPRRPVADLPGLTPEERGAFAAMIRTVTAKYNHLFDVPFPYSAGIHQRPTDGAAHPEWHLHMHFLPPLLRSASIRKFMVGYELMANPQRDITPESSAARLRALAPNT